MQSNAVSLPSLSRIFHKILCRFIPLAFALALALIPAFALAQVPSGETRPEARHHAGPRVYVPDTLKPWEDWVLHGMETERFCLPRYDRADTFFCAWPTELAIQLDNRGGAFSQSWLVHTRTRVFLPGGSRYWPRDVRVDGETVVVLEKSDRPVILLEPGRHTVTGRFSWRRMPEHIPIPSQSGLLSLKINTETIPFPDLDDRGRLWLKRAPADEKIENRLKIESFRLVDDDIPARILLKISLDVSGAARQVFLGPLYSPDRFTPVSLDSRLPARLEPDGRLQIQVRPGQYDLMLDLRHQGELKDLAFLPAGDESLNGDGSWPGEEIWSFKARPDLRLVQIRGVPAVDPFQTSVPKEWQTYPAYLLRPGDEMGFKEIKRGDPEPAPDQLKLDRTLWLRFDGAGYTIQDRIRGQKNTNWRLEMDPAITLGRVSVDGREQLITRRKGADRAGIELRNGRIDFLADSSLTGRSTHLPATGWDHDFQEVKGRLHLPPGWKLINAAGIDVIPNTWINQWTLLDFFVVLIFTIALAKLYSRKLACAAFLTLVLIFHEPNAPRYIWLALLMGFALLKYLPDGPFKRVVRLCQGLVLLAFVGIAIPYAVQTLRVGIYPQLADPWATVTDHAFRQRTGAAVRMEPEADRMPAPPQEAPMPSRAVTLKAMAPKAPAAKQEAASYAYRPRVMQYDPNALTQTGPGMPGWLPYDTVTFSWSGPVTRDQTVSFFLIGPKTNLALAFIRVALVIFLAAGMVGFRYSPGKGLSREKALAALKFSLAALLILSLPKTGVSAEIPSPQILDQLRERLLEPADCFPACADIGEMTIDLSRDTLSVTARVDARLDAAVPLPGHAGLWLPNRVSVDDVPADGLIRQKNRLWIRIPAGIHQVSLSGPVRSRNTLQLPFSLLPRHAAVRADGWSVQGLRPDGTVDGQLQFKRIANQEARETLEPGVLPPFALVERTLLLDLVWKVRTTVRRIGPADSAMVMAVPLIPGESVTTDGVRVKDGNALINLGAGANRLTWDSFLEATPRIHLRHAPTHMWTEIWRVDVSPVFHMAYDGIPVILHKTGNRWFPTWHPWPGETVDLTLTRPQGVDGRTLTLEKSLLELRPGRNSTAALLRLTVKSSQGGQHPILLPPGASLQEVNISGRIQPIRQDGQRVSLPIVPGSQDIALKWVESRGISTMYRSSEIDLGTGGVNTAVDIVLPRNRWPLFLGGDHLVGPAVLFWSVLIILLLVALGLSRTGLTPLKFIHWLLLGIGLSMTHLAAGILVVGWLMVLEYRKRAASLKPGLFNLMQCGLVFLTVAALGALVAAISNGLLGYPDMNITGNGSHSGLLRWFHDISDPVMPRAWVLSIPMICYRISMLAWALWVSFWLVGILKWAWQRFSVPVLWHKISLRPTGKKKQKEPFHEKE